MYLYAFTYIYVHTYLHIYTHVCINSGFSSYKYVESADRKIWDKKKYMGSECISLLNLPSGNHILSIKTNHTNDNHYSKISHIIMWP
jgi:hypothetical protein